MQECHGVNGEGNKEKFYPVIAGQHYKYLLRQMTEIRDGKRRNANPDMVKIIKSTTTSSSSPSRPTSRARTCRRDVQGEGRKKK